MAQSYAVRRARARGIAPGGFAATLDRPMRRLVPFAILLAACHGQQTVVDATTGEETTTHSAGPMRIDSIAVGPYVREIRGGCAGESDGCTARGDCETALVDCGGSDDRFRITARWSSSDDLDLFVTDRLGDTLSFLRPNGFTGGRMIVPSGRSCLPGRAESYETATYVGPDVLTGAYRVALHHFGSCMSGLGTVDVDVTVSAGGRYYHAYRATLAPRDQIEILTLTVSE